MQFTTDDFCVFIESKMYVFSDDQNVAGYSLHIK